MEITYTKQGDYQIPNLTLGKTGNKTHREIRDAEEDVPEEQQEGNIREPADVREAEQPLGGYRPGGEGTGRGGDTAAPEEEPGAGQGNSPDGMGRAHEQSQTSGGGSGTERLDLQLEWHDRETEDQKSSVFSFHKTDQ